MCLRACACTLNPINPKQIGFGHSFREQACAITSTSIEPTQTSNRSDHFVIAIFKFAACFLLSSKKAKVRFLRFWFLFFVKWRNNAAAFIVYLRKSVELISVNIVTFYGSFSLFIVHILQCRNPNHKQIAFYSVGT